MSVNLKFVARVGTWPDARKDEVFEALRAWAYEDEHFDRREVIVDILGGGPRNPVVRMEAYTTAPIVISRFGEWHDATEKRLISRVTAAGGQDISLRFTFPDED